MTRKKKEKSPPGHVQAVKEIKPAQQERRCSSSKEKVNLPVRWHLDSLRSPILISSTIDPNMGNWKITLDLYFVVI